MFEETVDLLSDSSESEVEVGHINKGDRSTGVRLKRNIPYQFPRLDNSPSDFTTLHSSRPGRYQQSYQFPLDTSWTSGLFQRLRLSCCANATDNTSDCSSVNNGDCHQPNFDPAKVALLDDNRNKRELSSDSPTDFNCNRNTPVLTKSHCQTAANPAQFRMVTFAVPDNNNAKSTTKTV